MFLTFILCYYSRKRNEMLRGIRMSEYHSRLVSPYLSTVQRISVSQTSHRHSIHTVHEKKSITGNHYLPSTISTIIIFTKIKNFKIKIFF